MAVSCVSCGGSGYRSCASCHGTGNVSCGSCNGSGSVISGAGLATCPNCRGDRKVRCSACSFMAGKTTCPTCGGTGQGHGSRDAPPRGGTVAATARVFDQSGLPPHMATFNTIVGAGAFLLFFVLLAVLGGPPGGDTRGAVGRPASVPWIHTTMFYYALLVVPFLIRRAYVFAKHRKVFRSLYCAVMALPLVGFAIMYGTQTYICPCNSPPGMPMVAVAATFVILLFGVLATAMVRGSSR